jgi:hypothetical protein
VSVDIYLLWIHLENKSIIYRFSQADILSVHTINIVWRLSPLYSNTYSHSIACIFSIGNKKFQIMHSHFLWVTLTRTDWAVFLNSDWNLYTALCNCQTYLQNWRLLRLSEVQILRILQKFSGFLLFSSKIGPWSRIYPFYAVLLASNELKHLRKGRLIKQKFRHSFKKIFEFFRKFLSEFLKIPNLSMQLYFWTSKAYSCQIQALQFLPIWILIFFWHFFKKKPEFFRRILKRLS